MFNSPELYYVQSFVIHKFYSNGDYLICFHTVVIFFLFFFFLRKCFQIHKCMPTPTWSVDPGQRNIVLKFVNIDYMSVHYKACEAAGTVKSILGWRSAFYLARKRAVESCPQLPPAWKVFWSDCCWDIPSDPLPPLQKKNRQFDVTCLVWLSSFEHVLAFLFYKHPVNSALSSVFMYVLDILAQPACCCKMP